MVDQFFVVISVDRPLINPSKTLVPSIPPSYADLPAVTYVIGYIMPSGWSRVQRCRSIPCHSCTPMMPKMKNTKKQSSSTLPNMGSVSRSSITRIRIPEGSRKNRCKYEQGGCWRKPGEGTHWVYDWWLAVVVALVWFVSLSNSDSPHASHTPAIRREQWKSPDDSTNQPDRCSCHTFPWLPSWWSSPERRTRR